jgi:hypothetical protein
MSDSIENMAPVEVTDQLTPIVTVSAARRGVIVYNKGPHVAAIVPAGGTFATAAQVIQRGERWLETEAAAAALYAICDTGQTATLNVLSQS